LSLDKIGEEYELARVPERRNNELFAEFERRKKVTSYSAGFLDLSADLSRSTLLLCQPMMQRLRLA
jgi:hypothetical protein